MKKNTLKTLVLIILSALCLTSFACANNPTFENFKDETVEANLFAFYELDLESVKGEDDNLYEVTATVVDANGAAVEVAEGKFVVGEISGYTITYTVAADKDFAKTRVVTVKVKNLTAPNITFGECETVWKKDSTFTFPTIEVTDFGGETLTPTLKVVDDAGNEYAIAEDGKSFVCPAVGGYKLVATAKNSFGAEGSAELPFTVVPSDEDQAKILEGITAENYTQITMSNQTGTFVEAGTYNLPGGYTGNAVAFTPSKELSARVAFPNGYLPEEDGFIYVWVAVVPKEGYVTPNGEEVFFDFNAKNALFMFKAGSVGMFSFRESAAYRPRNTLNAWHCFAAPIADARENLIANDNCMKLFTLDGNSKWPAENYTMLIGQVGFVENKSAENMMFKADDFAYNRGNDMVKSDYAGGLFHTYSAADVAKLGFNNDIGYTGGATFITQQSSCIYWLNLPSAQYEKLTASGTGYNAVRVYWAYENTAFNNDIGLNAPSTMLVRDGALISGTVAEKTWTFTDVSFADLAKLYNADKGRLELASLWGDKFPTLYIGNIELIADQSAILKDGLNANNFVQYYGVDYDTEEKVQSKFVTAEEVTSTYKVTGDYTGNAVAFSSKCPIHFHVSFPKGKLPTEGKFYVWVAMVAKEGYTPTNSELWQPNGGATNSIFGFTWDNLYRFANGYKDFNKWHRFEIDVATANTKLEAEGDLKLFQGWASGWDASNYTLLIGSIGVEAPAVAA